MRWGDSGYERAGDGWRNHPLRSARDEITADRRMAERLAEKTSAFRTWRVLFISGRWATCDTGNGNVKIKITNYQPSLEESVRVLLVNGDISLAEITGPSSYKFGAS